ncbi:MAG: DUF2344 domain-containing protein [Clostridiales bacterium]|nr:DUF2344 domain-containing protein [Clostridiales bacterium]
MVILKFEKTGTAALVSHVDNLRAITYLFNRAGLNVEYSQGFNPHMELGFSSPVALGVESLSEYVSVKTDYSDNLIDRLNAVSHKGIRFTRIFNAEVNLAATLNRATYRIEAEGIGDVICEISHPMFTICYQEKGEWVTKNVASRIFNAEKINSNTALVTLAIGNDNLRPDRLVTHLMRTHDLSGDYRITKLQAYFNDTPADEYLTLLQSK